MENIDITKRLVDTLNQMTNPLDHERSKSEEILSQMRNQDGFVKHLMIISNSDAYSQVERLLAVTCLNDNVKNFYSNKSGEVISEGDKSFLKANIIDSITLTQPSKPISETYQEILTMVAKQDYPHHWPDLVDQMTQRMLRSSEVRDLIGSLHTIKILVESH